MLRNYLLPVSTPAHALLFVTLCFVAIVITTEWIKQLHHARVRDQDPWPGINLIVLGMLCFGSPFGVGLYSWRIMVQ